MKPLAPALCLLACAAFGCRERRAEPIGPGAVLEARSEEGAPLTLRIDAVEKDPLDPEGDVFLYTASVRDPEGGTFKPYCLPDREGKNRAIPLQGSWDTQRNHVPSKDIITFACTNGALAKCVRFGYKPWKKAFGVSLAEYHQACVHVLAADYCGDGRPHTRDGTQIDIYDRLGIQKREPSPDLHFEAAWSPKGAVYLRKPRYGGEGIEEIVSQCPDRLRGRTVQDGAPLDAAAAMERYPEALLITESRITAERP